MIGPLEVKLSGKRLEDENYRFRSFLKGHADEEKLDRQFLALHNELFPGYDCSSCRNCCIDYAPSLKEEELEQALAVAQMPRDAFLRQHAIQTEDGFQLKKLPCYFLGEDKSCGLEHCKPQCCREYPHTDKPERLSSLLGIVASASVCPVVFEILQQLKKIYGFR